MLYCAKPHKEVCRFAAADFAILTADFIGREHIITGQIHAENAEIEITSCGNKTCLRKRTGV